MTLTEITATLDRLDIYPIAIHWTHVRDGDELTDAELIRWTVQVATCDELEVLTREWSGKRDDKTTEQAGVRGKHADVGARGLISHACHRLLPCWEARC